MRASAGVLEWFPVVDVGAPLPFLKIYGDRLHFIGTTIAHKKLSSPADGNESSEKKQVLVMGNEGYGLSDAILQHCHSFATIEGSQKNSGSLCLNVSVATGILLHQFVSFNTKL